jgi:predicted ester cyclase
MPELPRAVSIVTAIFLVACRLAPAPPPSPMRLLFEQALTTRDTAALSHAVAANLIFHARGVTATVTRAELWQMSQPILTAFPDIRFQVEDQVASGDKVAARVTFTGTHKGVWNGIQPTGRLVRTSEMFICRLEQRRLAECWQEWDELGLRRQLGVP